jgi:hypothetical protein
VAQKCTLVASHHLDTPGSFNQGFFIAVKSPCWLAIPIFFLGVHQKNSTWKPKKVLVGSSWFYVCFQLKQKKKEKTTKRAWRIETFVRSKISHWSAMTNHNEGQPAIMPMAWPSLDRVSYGKLILRLVFEGFAE